MTFSARRELELKLPEQGLRPTKYLGALANHNLDGTACGGRRSRGAPLVGWLAGVQPPAHVDSEMGMAGQPAISAGYPPPKVTALAFHRISSYSVH